MAGTDRLDVVFHGVGGQRHNVIPADTLLKLNLRWFDHGIRDTLLDGIERVNASVATAAGVGPEKHPDVTMKGHSRPLVNDSALVERLAPVISRTEGVLEVLADLPPVTGSEDCGELVPDGSAVQVDYGTGMLLALLAG